jgi:hypothetical protein
MVSFNRNFGRDVQRAHEQAPLFPLGQTVMTRAVQEMAASGQVNPSEYLDRHAKGDWGDIDASDKRANNEGLKPETQDRLVSSYLLNAAQPDGPRILVITEWDRSVTTVLTERDV